MVGYFIFLNPSGRRREIIPKSSIVDQSKLVFPGNIIEKKVSIVRECICPLRSQAFLYSKVVHVGGI